jgi:shikimate dehydrogenase
MISGTTRIYGIFGHPVEHTFSPGMHNAAFKKIGMDACYVPFPVAPKDLRKAVQAIVPLGLAGVNITVPHKVKVIPFLDDLSREASLIGAVNTIEVRGDKLIGHNTDGRGFLRSLNDNAKFDAAGKNFLIMGSGGAARAVGFSLALAKAGSISFYDPDVRKCRALARDISKRTGCDALCQRENNLEHRAMSVDCLINATPLGLKKSDPLPLKKEWMQKERLICDLVYNPTMTPLLKAARLRGAGILPGIGMLLYQGVIAFEIWIGAQAPIRVMNQALAKQMKS